MRAQRHRFLLGTAVLVIAALVAIAAVAISRRGILAVVTNSSSQPVTGVRVILGGKELDFGTVPAGGSARGYIVPGTDSDVAIAYTDPAGRPQMVRNRAYVTNGLKGRIDADVQGGGLNISKVDLRVGIF
jgi:hypothetical protein